MDDDDDDWLYDDEPEDDCWHEDADEDILTGRWTCNLCGERWFNASNLTEEPRG